MSAILPEPNSLRVPHKLFVCPIGVFDLNWRTVLILLKCSCHQFIPVSVIWFALSPFATIKADEEVERLARFVLAGHVDGRQKIKSGSFRAEGQLQEQAPEWGQLSGDVEVFCAFDFAKGKLRFDRIEPARGNSDPDAPVVGPLDWVPVQRGGQFSQTPEAVIVHPVSHNIISVLPASRKPPSWVRPFDVRALGSAHQHDLDAGTPFPVIVDAYEKQTVTQVAKSPEGVYRLDWVVYRPQSDFPSFNRSVWFDSQKDYAPVRMEFRVFRGYDRSVPVDSPAHIRWSEPRERHDLEMKKIDGVWVPETIVLTSKGGQKIERLILNWSDVNQPIDDSLFRDDGFPIDGVEFVVDSRLGRNIITKSMLPASKPITGTRPTGGSWRVFLLAVNLCLGLALAWWVRRRIKA